MAIIGRPFVIAGSWLATLGLEDVFLNELTGERKSKATGEEDGGDVGI
jgi:hypothetical protein